MVGETEPEPLRLSDDPSEIAACLSAWHEALKDGAQHRRGQEWWLADHGFGVRLQRRPKQTVPVLGADLTTDRDFEDIAVQINAGSRPGSGHVPTGIAIRGSERWLVRQGWLQAKRGQDEQPRADEAKFAAVTGMVPVRVTVSAKADTAGPRTWYVVCPLHAGSDLIRLSTADFTRQAARVRTADVEGAAEHPDMQAALDASAGQPEPLEFLYAGRDAGVGRRFEDEVVQALERRLCKLKVSTRRSVHMKGYRVDLEIDGPTPLLVEAKISAEPGYVQQGVGQLVLYPRLIERLVAHEKILLLPERPEAELGNAVASAEILVATYRWTGGNPGTGEVDFEADFIDLCVNGIPRKARL